MDDRSALMITLPCASALKETYHMPKETYHMPKETYHMPKEA
jgi:hypothetical protein